ncbi:SDR family oxidoreductase [Deinococcus sp. Arct2-2]|uniref:SDR family NAD(P)-dependent oxidoreductase n=1 Tax=Deinococcus sp. Arct2-2 TaxID=2568653 RepID=UPI0010A403F6|nr:SDR family oxidoreductase [Deinococcus sp. Arct2-2]THF67863.1 SDR family oxidoreductase [Deinococcus sp. Arct2-2]
MLLTDKHALIFAATGAIASQVARTYAREGATVWLSGRRADTLSALAEEIRAAGGHAETQVVDATDSQAVREYVAAVHQHAGRIDTVFNGIGGRPRDLGYPASSNLQELEDFLIPLRTLVGSTFLTSRAAAHHMARQPEGGSIVTLTATLSRMTAPGMAGISAACAAIEGLTRALAGEYGPQGIRVNCVRGSGMPETRTIQETVAGTIATFGTPPAMTLPPLGRPITVAETAGTAAFLASDLASGMTGQVVTVCAGAFV